MHIDLEALDASLRALRHAASEPDLRGALEKVVHAVERLFDCDGAGLMFAEPCGALRYVSATGELGRGLETAQIGVGEGPCLDAYARARIVATADLATDRRWPALAARVGAGDGVARRVLAAPVRLSGTPVGCLNLYAADPRPWSGSDMRGLPAYAELIEETVAAALSAERTGALAVQLEHALRTRVVIERAVGFLMADRGLDARQAFERLRRQARDRRRRTVQVAAELLGEPPPAEPGPAAPD